MTDRHTIEWQSGVIGPLLVLCILFSVSCTSPGSRTRVIQQHAPTETRATAEETVPGSQTYLALVQQRIREAWKSPRLNYTSQTYVTVVQFRLHKNGSVSRVKIEQSSGNESFDSAGTQAVHSASPLPAFPPDLSYPYVDAHIKMTAPSGKE